MKLKRSRLSVLLFWYCVCNENFFAKAEISFIAEPTDSTGIENKETCFGCEINVSVKPGSFAVWWKDNERLEISAESQPDGRKYHYILPEEVVHETGNYAIDVRNLNVSGDDGSQFVCQWRDKYGSTDQNSATATLTVVSGAESIRMEKGNTASTAEGVVTVVAGEKESIKCVVENSKPAATVTWELNGNDITKSSSQWHEMGTQPAKWTTTSTLTLTFEPGNNKETLVCHIHIHQLIDPANVSVTMDVQYINPAVTVVNTGSSTNSLAEGTQLILVCSVDGNPEPQFKWFKSSKGTEIQLHEYNVRELRKEATLSDDGIYSCEVENQFGRYRSQNSIDIIVSIGQVYNVQPSDRVGIQKQEVIMECIINLDDNHDANAVWIVDGEETEILGNHKYDYISAHPQNTGVYSFLIKELTIAEDDGTEFVCEWRSSEGTVTYSSTVAKLTVVVPPMSVTIATDLGILSPGAGITLNATNSKVFNCTAENTNTGTNLTWLLDDIDITASATQQQASGTEPKTVTITSTLIQSFKEYDNRKTLTCHVLVHVILDPTDVSVELNVQYLNSIVTVSNTGSGNSLSEGERLTLQCHADGNPTPDISWNKKIENVNIRESKTSSDFVINRVAREDSGAYWCEAGNLLGEQRSDDIFIEVSDSANVDVIVVSIISAAEFFFTVAMLVLCFWCMYVYIDKKYQQKQDEMGYEYLSKYGRFSCPENQYEENVDDDRRSHSISIISTSTTYI